MKITKSQLREIIRDEVNVSNATKLANDYISLVKAYNNPNYKSTAHTLAAMKKVEEKIRQMAKNDKYAEEFKKLIPDQFMKIVKEESNKLDEPSPFRQKVFNGIYNSVTKKL
jgi:hypothetical protein